MDCDRCPGLTIVVDEKGRLVWGTCLRVAEEDLCQREGDRDESGNLRRIVPESVPDL